MNLTLKNLWKKVCNLLKLTDLRFYADENH
jgi:hypothetical protein